MITICRRSNLRKLKCHTTRLADVHRQTYDHTHFPNTMLQLAYMYKKYLMFVAIVLVPC